ncbi:MAG: glycosyl hydrolase 115 family protein [Spirochaetales bacterium]|nr:glycosyl hydrolase 115 family protein [Spirochaetales bacterium]
MLNLSKESAIFCNCENLPPVQNALNAVQEDLKSLLGSSLDTVSEERSSQIRIIQEEGHLAEQFRIQSDASQNTLVISASDELGIVFGLYHFTEHVLGIDPYSFWTDQVYSAVDSLTVPEMDYISDASGPRFRGWFINDEDCLIGWDDSISITDELWRKIYETLLRTGYNTVIAGTGVHASDPHLDTAASMGLWVAQHHAEPLGAPMFHDIYPGVTARLPEEKDKFEELYRNAVKKSCHRKTLWTLGFRGQGDRPFFEDDPRHNTPEKRGKVISDMIRFQMDIVSELTKGPQVFIHYLYSESGELHRSGHLELPEEVIPVYCDNGFGAMRIRRHLCEAEKGISTMPADAEDHSALGLYYHVSFHDLEISNKLVPLIHPDVIKENLEPFAENPGFSFFICNVSNIRPHLFHIDLFRRLHDREDSESWRDSVDRHVRQWTARYFPGAEEEGQRLLLSYFDAPFIFNESYSDARAGEQVFHQGLRHMIRSFLREEDLRPWFTFLPEDFPSDDDCCRFILQKAEERLPLWRQLCRDADELQKKLPPERRQFFSDNLGMHIRYMRYSSEGFVRGVRGILACLDNRYGDAFILFYKSREHMASALNTLLEGEHGKWKNFYRGDWLTGTAETIRDLDMMISLSRIKGEDLWVNSTWMIEALGLDRCAISLLPQSSISSLSLARRLSELSEQPVDIPRKPDLTLLKERDLKTIKGRNPGRQKGDMNNAEN